MQTLILDSTSASIQVAMSGAAATTNPTFAVAYADNNGTTFTEGANRGALAGSTDVTVVGNPASGYRRVIKDISIYNGDSAAVTIFIKYDVSATQRTVAKLVLAVGDSWNFSGTYDSNGNLKTIAGAVSLTSGVTGTLPVANGGSGATTLTGVLKGNGTSAFSAATAGTDYLAPPSGTAILKANSGGALANATAGTDYTSPSSTETMTNKTLTNPTVNNYTEGVVSIGTVTTASTLALTNGTVQTATLTASTACTFTMPTATAGKSFVLLLKQAASTGNGTATFTGVKWSGGTAPTITATAGKMDILTFVSDGTNWYGSFVQNYTP